MRPLILAIMIVLVTSKNTGQAERDLFIVWNVGQGLWTTLVTQSYCAHFDIGGEYFPKKVVPYCAQKENLVYLSHGDWDHINLLRRLNQKVTKLCLAVRPTHPLSKSKTQFLKRFKTCQNRSSIDLNTIQGSVASQAIVKPSANDQSNVFLLNKKILLPGDSGQKAEKLWAGMLPQSPIHYLIAGHHGSRSSTSTYLLSRVNQLRMVIVSARKARYGHPHKKVLQRLKKTKASVLTTEAWNHIIIQL